MPTYFISPSFPPKRSETAENAIKTRTGVLTVTFPLVIPRGSARTRPLQQPLIHRVLHADDKAEEEEGLTQSLIKLELRDPQGGQDTASLVI